MLRLIFVFIIIVAGTFYAAQGPFYALLFYLWNAYFRPEEWTYGGLLLSLRLSYIIGLYLVLRTALSRPKLQLNFRTTLILLFLGQAVVGTFTSEHPTEALSFLINFAKVLLVSYFIVVLVTDRRRYRLTLVVIALSLGFECAKQGWVNLYRAPGAQNNNPIASLGDNNGVALGTMMLIPLFSALAQTATRRWEKLGHRFMGIGVFMRGFTTYSRGGFLAAGVLGLFTFVRSRRKLRALVGVAAIAVLVWSVMPRDFWDRIQTITASDETRDESAAGRLHFWNVAVVMANSKPLTGVGLNGFESSYEKYNVGGKFEGIRATHSTWFGVLADLGYPGLFLFVANWLMALWSCWRVHGMAKRDPTARDLGLYANALLTSLVVFAVGGTFLSSQYNEMMWHFFGLATALHLVALSEAKVPERALDGPRVPGRQLAVARP